MFLKITNKRTVSRKFYELIGASSKRERMSDPSVIGNKGSGAKLAVVPLLRQGLAVAVTSSDSEGGYILQYDTEAVTLGDREVHQIVFNYGPMRRFPSQLTLDAFRDWDRSIGTDGMKVFKALREYIANAWDEDQDFMVDFVEEITQAEDGMTVAYISATDEVRHILEHLSRYFKFLTGQPALFSSWCGSIHPKSEQGVTRLFSQGVLVDCKSARYDSSVFDYSLDSKHLLSEERVIRDWGEYIDAIGELLLQINEQELVSLLISMMTSSSNETAYLERSALGRIKNPIPRSPDLWRNAWGKLFGEKAIIGVGVVQVDQTARDRGYTVVDNVPREIRKLLQACGISSATDVTPKSPARNEEPDWEKISLTPEQQLLFDEAYVIFLRYYPKWRYPVHFFRGKGYRWKGAAGHCGMGERKYQEIWIAECSLTSVREILEILVHEGRHCHTKADDYSRQFTQDADRQLVEMLLANPEPPQENLWYGTILHGGIAVPKRFLGCPVHVLINDSELRFRIGAGAATTILSCILPKPVTGQVSQRRTVGMFRQLGHVSIPASIREQLPEQLTLLIH